MKPYNQISRLFLKGKSKGQLRVAMLALGLGASLLLFSIQLISHVVSLTTENEQKASSKFLTIVKHVGYGSTFGLVSNFFSKEEVKAIGEEPFFEEVVPVRSNAFEVAIKGNQFLPFYSELFLQSVPNHFIDIEVEDFSWKEGESVPLIVSSHFYNLYNHGFAPSQGLPSLPKSLLLNKSFTLSLSGNKGAQSVRCHVFGFSDRINSLIVPSSFLDWGNKSLAGKEGEITMVMAKVNDSSSPAISNYLTNKGYVVNKEQLSSDHARLILTAIISFFAILALVIFVLSVLQITVYTKLVIAENKDLVFNMVLMGYDLKMIARPLLFQFASNFLKLYFVVLGVVLFSLWVMQYYLTEFNFEVPYMSVSTMICCLILPLLFFVQLEVNIRGSLKKIL